jgi:hypothetical protein
MEEGVTIALTDLQSSVVSRHPVETAADRSRSRESPDLPAAGSQEIFPALMQRSLHATSKCWDEEPICRRDVPGADGLAYPWLLGNSVKNPILSRREKRSMQFHLLRKKA